MASPSIRIGGAMWGFALALVFMACGQDSGSATPDSGGDDGGIPLGPDASTDTGHILDAGPSEDAIGDAGLDAADGASPRADIPGIPCTDSISDVYVTPPSLPPMTAALRGDVVRCAADVTYAVADVESQISAKGIQTRAKSGVSFYRIAFRTMRGTGAAGISTARVYLPATPLPLPLPVIAVGHPTDGLASSCAPSKDLTSNEDLALPWAGAGYAVIVPDYAGFGNDDAIQGYVDNHDTAYSVLDSARALRKFLAAGVFGQSVLLSGWSQGGGGVLSAQALVNSYGCDGTLAGVIVFAAEWQTRMNSFGYVDMLNNPSELTIQAGISNPVVAVLRQYAYDSLYLGPAHATDSFPAANQSGIGGAITSLCGTPLGGYLQASDLHISDFIDDTFRTTLLACINAGDAGAGDSGSGCVDPGRSYYAFLQQNILTANPAGPPMLYVQGLADYIMPAASEAACNIAKLQADGVAPQVCVDAPAQHTDVVGRNQDFAMKWGEAVLQGTALPACSSAGMPACTP
jgi:hypothetical protein